MVFSLGAEDDMIATNVWRLFAENFGRDVIARFAEAGAVEPSWRPLIGNAGLLGVCASTEVDGLGLGATAAAGIARAAGAFTVPFPVSTGIAAAATLASQPDLAQRVMAAEAIVAIAPPAALTVEQASRGQSRVRGVLDAVPWASVAEALIVEAAGRRWLIALDAPGVTMRARKSIDPTTPAMTIALEGVPAELLGPSDPGWSRLRALLAAAELTGAARAALDRAVDYMKLRRQFGQEIGRFQALKHIAATDALCLESMDLSVSYAAFAHDAGATDAVEAVHIAKAYASDAARRIAEDSIQCHGGIGFTWEYGLHFLLRRILCLAATFGTAAEHREALIGDLIASMTPDGGRHGVHDR